MSEAADSGFQRTIARPPGTSGAEPNPTPGAEAAAYSHGYPLDPPLEDVRIPVRAPHVAATSYSRLALMYRFPEAEVGEDLHLRFSEPGKIGRSLLAPDVLVALGVPRRETRADFDADALGAPDFVLEVLSRSTWRHDVRRKLDCYQRIGVRECLLFDVTGEDLASTGADLWGYTMTPASRRPLAAGQLPNGEHGVYSNVLGLWAYVAKRVPPAAPNETWALAMRWHDPSTNADLPDPEDALAGQAAAQARAEAECARAEAESARADAAQRRVEELEARLRRRGGRI